MKNADNTFAHLIKRAYLYLDFLEQSSNVVAFPDRIETRKEIGKIEASASLRKAQNFNRVINIHLIAKDRLTHEEKVAVRTLFEEKLNEPQDYVKEKFLAIYNAIIKKGKAKSQTEFLDGIEIFNSNDLGLTIEKKSNLKDILDGTLVGREIDRLAKLGINLPD
jgi:hypothetical protein